MSKNLSFLLSAVLFITLFFAACSGSGNLTADEVSEISTRSFEGNHNEIYRASLNALSQSGFIVRQASMDTGRIEAHVLNRGFSNDDLFFGYNSQHSESVRAEIEVQESSNGSSIVRINFIEVFPPEGNLYQGMSAVSTERQLRIARYYENMMDRINEILNNSSI